MGILTKTKNFLISSPKRLPRRVKNSKRWRMSIAKLNEYIDYITNFEGKDLDYKENN